MKDTDHNKSRSASSYTVDEIRAMTPGERIELCWLLTQEACGLTDDVRMRRDVARIIPRGEQVD